MQAEKLTEPAKPFTEETVIVSVSPEVAPEVKLSVEGDAVRVKEGAVRVATTVAEEVAARVAPVVVPEPEMVAVRAPEVPMVVVIVTTAVPVPPEARVTEVGRTEQAPAAVPFEPRLAAVHVRETGPVKPLTEVSVTVLVALLPEIRDTVAGDDDMVKEGAERFTTITAEATEVLPLVPVSRILRTPEVPAVVLMRRVLVEVLPEVRVTVGGVREQEPAAVPLALVTTQLSATVPAKVPVEVMVRASVLPVVAPEMRL